MASLEGFEPSFSALKGQRVRPLHHRDVERDQKGYHSRTSGGTQG